VSFVHLHTHSHYSFLQGTQSPKVLLESVAKAGMTAVAVTDSSNVCGVVEASEAAEKERCARCGSEVKKAGEKKTCGGGHEDPPTTKVRLVVGVELWTMDGEGRDGKIPGTGVPAPGCQLVLLVRDAEGWRNLSALVTLAHRQRSFCPRITVDQLREHRAGLHVLTGGRWGIFREPERAEERLLALVAAVGKDSVDAEVVDHGFDEDGPRNVLAAELARKVGIPIVATNDSRYLRAEDSGLLEVMVEIGTGGDHELALVSTSTDQAWLKSEAEMAELWPAEWLDRSGQITESCTFSLPRGKPMLPRVEPDEALDHVMGRFPAPGMFPTVSPDEVAQIEGPSDRAPVNLWFRWLCRRGLEIRLREEPHALRFATEEEYTKQLEFECGVIEQMEYVVYHLIVSEFTNWAKDNGVYVGPGRGSAAGSVAVWALRITDVNPRQFGLFFERFLNPERRGLPDIDMDFEQEGRERVIAHVRQRYGEACVGQILTIGKMKAKAALTDAARVCFVRFDETKFWSAHVDGGANSKLKDSLDQGYLKAMRDGSPLFRRVSDLALHLEGKPRQQGVHPAGVIITSDPLSSICPMHYVPADDLTCTGLDMDAAEKIGLVKFDFLGLKTLDVVKIAQRTVAERTGSVPTIVDPLFDDPGVFELLQQGDTEGIFQLESGGMTRLIKKLVPKNFEEVICMLALYRPGPLKAGMVSSWIERKHGREEVESIHPLLDEVLRPTYGLMVYQEQALSTARILAGFSIGEADLLRRAIGKKKADEMAAQRQNFVRGCWETNQISAAEATRVFNLIDYFSGYSFNKAHSAAYAIVTYMTAKLKVHHRVDFMAATMTLDVKNTDKVRQYSGALRRTGVGMLRPDVNRGGVGYTPEDGRVRFGLGTVRELESKTIGQILAGRPFSSIEDLVERVKMSKKATESLIWAGALDSVEPDRFDAWWRISRPKQKELPKKVSADQMLLFGGGRTVGEVRSEEEKIADEAAKPPRPTAAELAGREASALGVSLGTHPLARYSDVSGRIRTHTLLGLRQIGPEKVPFTVVGRIETCEIDEDRRGDAVAFVTVEDTEASIRAVLRGDVLKFVDREAVLVEGMCIVLHGNASAFETDDPTIMVERIEALSAFRWRAGRTVEMEIVPSDRPFLGRIRQILDGCVEGGTHEVLVKICGGEGDLSWARLDRKICPTDDLLDDLERITGRPDVIRIPTSSEKTDDVTVSVNG